MPGVAEVFADAKRSDAEVPPSTCSVFLVTKAERPASTQQTKALTLDPIEALRYE